MILSDAEMTKFKYRGDELPLRCDLLVLEKIQEKIGDIQIAEYEIKGFKPRIDSDGVMDTSNSVEALEARHSTLERTLSESTRLQETLEEALANARRNYEEAGSSLESYESQLASARTALAELERQQSETSDESITQQIEEQREQMQELEGVVQRAERAYAQSGDAVQNWQRQLNDARTQSMRFTAELEDVSQYLEEARQSADHTASSIDEMGRRVRETSNDVETSTSDTAEAVEDLTSVLFGKLNTASSVTLK